MPIIIEAGGTEEAAYTFKELREEAAARGFTDMLDGGAQEKRLGRWVNQAYRELLGIAPWPFLNAQIEGIAPLEIPELGHILSVSNLANETRLYPLDERQVTDFDPAQGEIGTAQAWYLEGLNTLVVWPLDTNSRLRVKCVVRPIALVADADKVQIPSTYQDLIVDGAVVRLYKNRDNFEAAQFVRQEWQLGIKGMKHDLLKPNYDRERTVNRTGLAGDYLG